MRLHKIPARLQKIRGLTSPMFIGVVAIAGTLLVSDRSLADDDDDLIEGEIVVHLEAGESIDAVNARMGTTTLEAYPVSDLYLVEPPTVPTTEEWLEDFQDDPAVRSAEQNFFQDTPEGVRQLVIIAVGGEYVDYEDQALTDRIGLDLAHEHARGEGVTIAVLDTGVDPNHEALVGRLSPHAYDFVDDDSEPWETFNSNDDDLDGQMDEGFGHGTMVAGILALVAPEATILPLRVLGDDARGDVFDICKAIRYAADHGADIINLSFGIPVEVDAISDQIEFIEDLDVVFVAAAGNESNGSIPYYPAAESEVVMVAATDSIDIKADFSDWGDEVDLSAPGTGVRSAFPGGQWALGSGCSFATPFVAGGAALALSADPNMGTRQLRDLVAQMSQPIDDLPGNAPYADGLGSGRVYLPYAIPEEVASVEPLGVPRVSIRTVPNPTSGLTTFQWAAPSAQEDTVYRLHVLDVTGRVLHDVITEDVEHSWDVQATTPAGGNISPGIYFVRVSDAGTDKTLAQGRFVIFR